MSFSQTGGAAHQYTFALFGEVLGVGLAELEVPLHYRPLGHPQRGIYHVRVEIQPEALERAEAQR